MWRTVILLSVLCSSVFAEEAREPSEFRLFSDKRDKEIEARILSITDDGKAIQLEKRDGGSYEIAVTILSLDDQQFVQDWLRPKGRLKGKLRVFGVLPKDKAIEASAADAYDSFQSIHAAKFGWMALLPDGKVVDSAGRFAGLSPVSHVYANTVWVALAGEDGRFINANGNRIHPDITTAIQCVNGNGHSAAILSSGKVKVFGRKYDTDETFDAPGDLSGIIALASTQGAIAAVGEDGSVHCWGPAQEEGVSFTPGDGAVEVSGSIFSFLALTRSGEVYQWRDFAVDKAGIPGALEERENYIKVRSNGSTYAAQKEDRSWIAWGMNGAGIVDHINQLGPVEDIAFFSEPGQKDHGYVVWIENEG